jgi:hypothetical protein
MCLNGSWDFAYIESRWFRRDIVVEECTICDEYRKRSISELSFRDTE